MIYHLQKRPTDRSFFDDLAFTPNRGFQTVQSFTSREEAEAVYAAVANGFGGYDYQLICDFAEEPKPHLWACTYFRHSKGKEFKLVSGCEKGFRDYLFMSRPHVVFVDDSPEEALNACELWLEENYATTTSKK